MDDVGAVIDALYEAYFAGDARAMVEAMSADVDVRFLGRPPVRGSEAAFDFFTANNTALENLDFRIRRRIVDGENVAVLWDETATAAGRPYENHGVDVFKVVGGAIAVLRVNNDVVKRRAAFGSEPPDA